MFGHLWIMCNWAFNIYSPRDSWTIFINTSRCLSHITIFCYHLLLVQRSYLISHMFCQGGHGETLLSCLYLSLWFIPTYFQACKQVKNPPGNNPKEKVLTLVKGKLNPLKYERNKGVDDAKLFISVKTYKHLEKPKSHARLLFADFSPAFNRNAELYCALFDRHDTEGFSKWCYV